MPHSALLFVVAMLLQLSFAAAQFQFFDQMFGHQQQQQQPPSGHSQWATHAEQIQCSQYLCPETLVCVSSPRDCPCPNVVDVKCVIPDETGDDPNAGTVLCVRGPNECKDAERLMKRR